MGLTACASIPTAGRSECRAVASYTQFHYAEICEITIESPHWYWTWFWQYGYWKKWHYESKATVVLSLHSSCIFKHKLGYKFALQFPLFNPYFHPTPLKVTGNPLIKPSIASKRNLSGHVHFRAHFISFDLAWIHSPINSEQFRNNSQAFLVCSLVCHDHSD
jgi:hypothetical protein